MLYKALGHPYQFFFSVTNCRPVKYISNYIFCISFKVQVYVSLSHGEVFSRVHSPSAMFVQSVTTRGFKVCIRETGFGTNGTGVVDWLAFQTNSQIIQGAVTIDGVWTTQSKCNKVAFKQVS